jgi:deoxyadenosine/deoxycytidine kinase
MKRRIIVIEGLPAMGKTTLANALRDKHGFYKVNESLGRLGERMNITDQKVMFEETVSKYTLALLSSQPAIIDRGYPSLLGWDYTSEQLGYAHDLSEKRAWINSALQDQIIYEPDLYIYLRGEPSLSIIRRPREKIKADVWSGEKGMQHLADYYEQFFRQPDIDRRTMVLDALIDPATQLELIRQSIKGWT